jgi:hypothetical protein
MYEEGIEYRRLPLNVPFPALSKAWFEAEVPDGASQAIAFGKSCVWPDAVDVVANTYIATAMMILMGCGTLHWYFGLDAESTV